ncbi:hypothetical protein [Arthrobacter glacialis]|uniref:hypothetical protein n=1 Tax=Arthrobacter glacialis TaxID=1664 RepID=UPI001056F9A6|nr:hypothetical protein [Arthrobacter glacialis]
MQFRLAFSPGRTRPVTPRSLRPPLALVLCSLVLCALLLGGCNPMPADVTHYTPAPATVVDAVDCERSVSKVPYGPGSSSPPLTGSPSTAAVLAGSVPAGFVPVKLVECFPPDPALDAQGQVTGWTVKQLWFTGDFAAVLAALAVPSDSQAGIACLAIGEILPSIWLVNAEGQAANVVWPLDVCGMSKPELREALRGLTLSDTKILAADSGPAPERGP